MFRAEVQLVYSGDQKHDYFEEDLEKKSVNDNLGDKFDSKDFDFGVVCQGKEIKCHKLILALKSEYFKTLFHQTSMKTVTKEGTVNFTENSSSNVKIDDIDYDTMHLVLSYLYSLKLPESLSREQVSELLVAADRIQVIIMLLFIYIPCSLLIGVKNVTCNRNSRLVAD